MQKTRAILTTTVAATCLGFLPSTALAVDHVTEYAYAYGQSVATATATCPVDYYASGGAASAYSGHITYEEPTGDGRGWTANAEVSTGDVEVSLNVTAVCVHE